MATAGKDVERGMATGGKDVERGMATGGEKRRKKRNGNRNDDEVLLNVLGCRLTY